MGVQEKDVKSREEGLIDVTEILTDYVKILRRMWAWILVLAIVGAVVAYIMARKQYTPAYTASATFVISVPREQENMAGGIASYYDNSTASQMAETFPFVLDTGLLREKVAEDIGVSVIASGIKAEVTENTNLLVISVTDRDAGMAYEILQSVVENYPEVSERLVGKVTMEMLDETGIPALPDYSPDYGRKAGKGAAAGMAAGLLWSAFLVLTRRTVRKESDVHKYLNTRCLGSVPEIAFKRRSDPTKVRLVLTESKVEDAFQEPLRIIRNKIEYHADEYHIKTFLITSALAGEGKSTVAVNLALSLAQTGRRVVLADCDLRNPSDRKILGVEEGEGLGEVLQGKKELAECMMTAKDLGLDKELELRFVPGGKGIADGSELLGSREMRKIIKDMEKWADYVILDTAPAGVLTDAVVLAQYAEGAIFVVRKDFSRVDYIMDGMEQLAESHIQIIGGILNGV